MHTTAECSQSCRFSAFDFEGPPAVAHGRLRDLAGVPECAGMSLEVFGLLGRLGVDDLGRV